MITKTDNCLPSKNLYGLGKYLSNFMTLIDSDKLPKVLMFSGKKGQGKFTLSYHLMSYYFDKKNYDRNSQSVKNENKIFNNIQENNNSNILYYNCSNNKVKIDDIRKLRTDIQKSSINNMYRFIIFDDVEYLNNNCVNALLKTIEEPIEINHFVLINNQNNNILETLKSRSIEILFFLNKLEKINIIQKLLKDFKIEEKIDLSNTSLTPGNYIKYNNIITENKININDKLIDNIKKLFRLNKLKKNIEYLNFAIYLINQYYFNKSKGKISQNNVYNDKRTKIIKKIYDLNNLNLNQVNLIAELENYI